MMLGGFDGLHFGHKKLLSVAKSFSLPVGIMTITGGKAEENIFTVEERRQIFSKADIDFVLELPFAEIKDLTPDAFSTMLVKEFASKRFVCGEDFRFGKMAGGTPETLKQATHVPVEVVDLEKIDGEKVSTYTIKQALRVGDIAKANRLLDSHFFIMGEVIEDRKVGRSLGFPTANIVYPDNKFSIQQGVYETQVVIDGKAYKGITNYGARPTFDNRRVITETYLHGFDGDLYGQILTVELVRYLRPIEKFDSVETLVKQLQTDIRRITEND